MPGQRWTEEELAYLLERAACASANEIATALGRSPSAVWQRLAELRRRGELMPQVRPWTAEEDDRLAQGAREGLRRSEIAAQLARTPAAVTTRAINLRATGIDVPKFSDPRPWLEEDDRALEQAIRAKATDFEIAVSLDRTVGSVRARIATRTRELEARRPRWTPERRARLAERRRAGATQRELAREFGRDVSTIKRQLRTMRALGYELRST